MLWFHCVTGNFLRFPALILVLLVRLSVSRPAPQDAARIRPFFLSGPNVAGGFPAMARALGQARSRRSSFSRAYYIYEWTIPAGRRGSDDDFRILSAP